MKKGVLLTVGMLFLSSLVFSLAVIILHNTQSTESRFSEIILHDRLYDLDSSIQRGFKEIFTRNSGITLTLEDDLVTITETLPHPSTLNFAAEMDAYEDYLEETYYQDPIITVDDSVLTTIKGSLPFYIMPHNIVVDHSSFPSGDLLQITPPSLNLVKNYSISLTTTKQLVAIRYEGMGMQKDFPVRISVTTDSGVSIWQDDINPSHPNTWTLTFDEGEPTEEIMTITINNPAHLIINRNGITTYHDIEIALNHKTEEMNYIKYPDDLFKINIPGGSIDKTSTARLA